MSLFPFLKKGKLFVRNARGKTFGSLLEQSILEVNYRIRVPERGLPVAAGAARLAEVHARRLNF